MFPFALIDDAAQQIQTAADAVVAATDATSFDGVKFPISMDVPDRVLTRTIRDADGIKFASDEYAFKQQTADNDVSLECWDGQSLAQKFITDASVGNKVRKITLTLNRIGSTSGALTASIYADDGGKPGTLLGSSTAVNISTISAKGNVTFTFGTELALTKNTVYWIVLTSTGTSANKIVWYCKTSNPDATYPAAVKVGVGEWTINSDKNMTYILIGYYTTASAEFPVKLAVGPEYQSAYFSATVDANSSVTVDIKNADTGDILYANLTNGQAVALNPSNTPNLKIIASLTRDPGQTLTNPILSAIGFSGRTYQNKYQFIDRDFRPTAYSKHIVGNMGLVRTSGGLKLVSSTGTLKANSDAGYVDASTGSYGITSAEHKMTQLYYTDVAVTITGFRMRVKGAATSYAFDGGVWLDNAGVPGALQGSLKNSGQLGTTDGVWKTITFDTPVEIPAGTYFHVGAQYNLVAIYGSTYATPFEGQHVTAAAGTIYRTLSYAMDLYGKCASASVTSELILPGVKEHGLVYPLAYLPAGAGISMVISDPLTGMAFHTLGTGEKCSLALLPTELFNRIKLAMTITQNLGSPDPVIGLCYTYTGSEMAPEPVKRYKIMTYTFGALGAAGNYLTINGRGKVLAMSISGSAASSVYGDGHKLTLDNLNVAYYRFYNVTVKTLSYLWTNFNWAGADNAINFEFNEKLSWDLTEYYGAQNGGSITVALEV